MPLSVEHIVEALSSLGGEAHLDRIAERVEQIAPPPLPADIGASIRARIQERSSGTRSYLGRDDLFESVHGVDARRGIWRLKSDVFSPSNPDNTQEVSEAFIDAEEGRATLRVHLRRERSRALIIQFKAQLNDCTCQVCGFNFESFYGRMGKDFIEAHHVVPVAKLKDGRRTKISDLVPVCSNCHRMIHRNGLVTVQEITEIVKSQRMPSLL